MSTQDYTHKQPYISPVADFLVQIPSQPIWSSHEDILNARNAYEQWEAPQTASILSDPAIITEDRTIPGPRGDIRISILSPKNPKDSQSLRPGIVHFHGGGMVLGNRYTGVSSFTSCIKDLDAIVVTVEYGLAPENTGSALVDDCYAGLCWFSDHLNEFKVDSAKLMVAGGSAGGGLTAGVALMARDRGGPKLCAQMLICPMLDDRCHTLSMEHFSHDNGTHNGATNKFAWSCVLGDQTGKEGVSKYIAPARATDLSNLPTTFIDVGGAEPFRDEVIDYALRLSACGVITDLHVWGGGSHGFEFLIPDLVMSKAAVQAKLDWVHRIFSS